MMKIGEELQQTIAETISDEVKELLSKHLEAMAKQADELGSAVIKVSLASQIDASKPVLETKTTISYTAKTTDSITDEIEDPNQVIMAEVVESAKGRPTREDVPVKKRGRGRPRKNPL